jgi:hypothetical protein
VGVALADVRDGYHFGGWGGRGAEVVRRWMGWGRRGGDVYVECLRRRIY